MDEGTVVAFLKGYVTKYRELRYLAGAAESSPEGNQQLGVNALAPKIFENVEPTAIEADRTFLGLILFYAVLEIIKEFFPNLSEEWFQKLRNFTLAILENNSEFIELTDYALACNDLGKTQALVDENVKLRGRKAPDHDQLLHEMVHDKIELFPGLLSLNSAQQEIYKHGLSFNFNLGQIVQGENLPYNLYATANVPKKSKALRLVAEVFDFAGVTGHINWKISMTMNDINCELFLTAVDAILAEENTADEKVAIAVYTNYLRYRAAKCGLDHEPLFYWYGRLAALSRATDEKAGHQIKLVVNQLSLEDQQTLLYEMTLDGFTRKAILIYYFPAVIANAIKAVGDFSAGLKIALQRVAQIYRTVRQTLVERGESDEPGVYTENVISLAREMNGLEKIKS